MPIDAHVHFFTRALMSESGGRLLALLRAAAAAEHLIRRHQPYGSLDTGTLVELLESGFPENSTDALKDMDAAYGPNWSYVPLMLDLEYTFTDSSALEESSEHDEGRQDPDGGRLRRMRHSLWDRVEEAWELAAGGNLEHGAARLLAPDSFRIQRRDLTALKADIPDRIFPFLGLDPRRQHDEGVNLTELAGDYVGPGCPFCGIKLYTATGFSPTDPALFNPGGLYEHCVRNRIPITVHFALGGFATPLSSVWIRGDIYNPDYGEAVPAGDRGEGRLNFATKMTGGTIPAAVHERQVFLNHPRLWDKVLRRWPGLIINFAHAGGSEETAGYLNGEAGWMWWLFHRAMKYRGVYADFSAHPGDDGLLEPLGKVLKKHSLLRRKLLFGSDYFLSALSERDPAVYLGRHREAFGFAWKAISERNAARFLSGGGFPKQGIFRTLM